MGCKNLILLLFAILCLEPQAHAQIQAGQAVDIRIMGVPAGEKAKIDAVYPVAEDGTVTVPFLGKIKAAGLGPDELAKAIEDAYKQAEVYANPTVGVIAERGIGDDMLPKVVHIGGQVRKPGPCVFEKGMTVFQAVQAAGGATEFGAINRVRLWRNGKEQKVDLTKPEGKKFVTEPQDTIEMPQRHSPSRD